MPSLRERYLCRAVVATMGDSAVRRGLKHPWAPAPHPSTHTPGAARWRLLSSYWRFATLWRLGRLTKQFQRVFNFRFWYITPTENMPRICFCICLRLKQNNRLNNLFINWICWNKRDTTYYHFAISCMWT